MTHSHKQIGQFATQQFIFILPDCIIIVDDMQNLEPTSWYFGRVQSQNKHGLSQ